MKIMDDQPTTTSLPSSSSTDDSSTIYVENIPLHIATKPQSSSYISTIREFFRHKFGPVKSVYLPRPNEQLRAKLGNQRIKSYNKEELFRGFCFVVFEEEKTVGLVMKWIDKMNEISNKSEKNDEAGEDMGQEKHDSSSQTCMDGKKVLDTDVNDDFSIKETGINATESSNYLLRNEHQLRLKIMSKTRWNQLEEEYVSWLLSQSELVKSYIDNQRSRRLAVRTTVSSNTSVRDNHGKPAVGSTDFATDEQEPGSETENVMHVEETRQAKTETENSPKDYIADVIVHFTNIHPEAKISVLNSFFSRPTPPLYIHHPRSSTSGYLRFPSSESAQHCVDYFTESCILHSTKADKTGEIISQADQSNFTSIRVKCRIVKGDEEVTVWEEMASKSRGDIQAQETVNNSGARSRRRKGKEKRQMLKQEEDVDLDSRTNEMTQPEQATNGKDKGIGTKRNRQKSDDESSTSGKRLHIRFDDSDE